MWSVARAAGLLCAGVGSEGLAGLVRQRWEGSPQAGTLAIAEHDKADRGDAIGAPRSRINGSGSSKHCGFRNSLRKLSYRMPWLLFR